MEPDCPVCFGKPSQSGLLDRCPVCEFRESCAFCAKDDGSSCDHRLGHVSYERYSYSRETAAPPAEPEDAALSGPVDCEAADALQVMEFLLDLDNYTAELLHEVLHGNCSTASELARKFGVSRQAIHRKIVDCCTLHPQLRKLFITRLYRCRRMMRDGKRLSEKKNPDQLELF